MEQLLEQAMFEKRLSPKGQNATYQPFASSANKNLSPKMQDSSVSMNTCNFYFFFKHFVISLPNQLKKKLSPELHSTPPSHIYCKKSHQTKDQG